MLSKLTKLSCIKGAAVSLVFLITGFNSLCLAKPKSVIIIRHGEKIPGQNHLDLRGYERAAALPFYFSGTPLFNDPLPTHLFAAGLQESDSSVRPIETCSPIASHLKLHLNVDFMPEKTKELAKEILTNPKYNNSCVLICWEHKNIRPLTIALGAEDPGFWDPKIFDLVYKISYDSSDKPKLEKILQKLMFGDRATFNDPAPTTPAWTKKNVDEN